MELQSDKKQVIREIARGTGFLSSGEAVAKAFSLLGFVLLLRSLSVAEYGTYRLVFAVYGALYVFTVSGVNSFLQPDLARELREGARGSVRALFRDFIFLKLATGLVLFGIALFGAQVIEGLYSARIALYLRVISPLFVISTLTEIARMGLAVDRRFGSLSLHNVSGSITKFILIGALVWYGNFGVLGAVIASAGAMLVPLVLILPAFFRTQLMNISEISSEAHPLWRFIRAHGKWAIIDSYFNGLGRNLAPLVIKAVAGTEAVAVYGVADSIVTQASSLSALKAVLIPIVPREIDHPEHAAKILSKGAKYSIAFNILEGVALAVGLPFLIVYGFPHYAPYIRLFQWALLALIPLALGGLLTAYLFALRMQREQFVLTTGQTVAEALLLAIWGSLLGMPGLIVAYVVVAVAYQGARLWVVFRRRPDLTFSFRDIAAFDAFDRFLLGKMGERVKTMLR
ncbi:MAG: oligosaccharide flippase family protein [Candidatus Yanofskybacteria bacterium]|nr:oligosaccharide flippase family protein [Candidatus Yanofskybacteria bacterium]